MVFPDSRSWLGRRYLIQQISHRYPPKLPSWRFLHQTQSPGVQGACACGTTSKGKLGMSSQVHLELIYGRVCEWKIGFAVLGWTPAAFPPARLNPQASWNSFITPNILGNKLRGILHSTNFPLPLLHSGLLPWPGFAPAQIPQSNIPSVLRFGTEGWGVLLNSQYRWQSHGKSLLQPGFQHLHFFNRENLIFFPENICKSHFCGVLFFFFGKTFLLLCHPPQSVCSWDTELERRVQEENFSVSWCTCEPMFVWCSQPGWLKHQKNGDISCAGVIPALAYGMELWSFFGVIFH